MDKQELKLGARILENLPHMSPDVMQGWINNPKALKEFLAGLVPKESPKSYLRHLESVTLAPTKGSVTLAEAEDVFTWLDSDFKKWRTNVPGEDTDEALVDVHEMTHDGTHKTLFGSLGDPRQLALSQGQVVEFCRNHRDSLQLNNYGTFFLFEVNGKLFIANVCVDVRRISAAVQSFYIDRVWNADQRHRLVVQQQTV